MATTLEKPGLFVETKDQDLAAFEAFLEEHDSQVTMEQMIYPLASEIEQMIAHRDDRGKIGKKIQTLKRYLGVLDRRLSLEAAERQLDQIGQTGKADRTPELSLHEIVDVFQAKVDRYWEQVRQMK